MTGLLVDASNERNDCGTFAKIRWWFIVCLFVISLVPLSTGVTHTQVELRREILSHYNKSVPPSFEKSPTDVGFVYLSNRILRFDESAGTLTVQGQLLLNWFDQRLKWIGDTNYDTINYFTAKINDIWTPKVNVFNSGRAEHYAGSNNPVFCTKVGRVIWITSVELHPACTLEDLRWYPIDTHTCTLSLGALYPQEIGDIYFGSWSKLAEHGFRLSREHKSPQWDLLNLEHRGSYTSAGNQAIFYHTDEFIFTIRRQGWPLLVSFLPLMLCCTFLSWASFALPLHQKQLTKRLSVSTYSLFLSSFFLLVLIDTVPGVGQKPPVIIKVNVCVVIMAFLTSLHTVVVSRVHRISTTHLKALQKLPVPAQYLLGLNKLYHAAKGGADELLANMESSPDNDQNTLQRRASQEDDSDAVNTAYDRAHLILQITVSTLTITFICLV